MAQAAQEFGRDRTHARNGAVEMISKKGYVGALHTDLPATGKAAC
jgi:hypothetical protein